MILNYPDGPNVITRVLIKGNQGGIRIRDDVTMEAKVRMMKQWAKKHKELLETGEDKGADSFQRITAV